MLHLLTMAHEYNYLSALYNSIPKENDIKWWVCHLSNNKPLDRFVDDERITIIKINPEEVSEKWNGSRLNMVFSQIIDGQFHILDEDTLFHPNCYKLYKENVNYEGLIIGQQICSNNTLRLQTGIPTSCCTDTGSCICHYSVLKKFKWNIKANHPDFEFWKQCYDHFGESKTRMFFEPISFYNAQKWE